MSKSSSPKYYKFILNKEMTISSNKVNLKDNINFFYIKIRGIIKEINFESEVNLYYEYNENKLTDIFIKKLKLKNNSKSSISSKTCKSLKSSEKYDNIKIKINHLLKIFFEKNFVVDKENENIIITLHNEQKNKFKKLYINLEIKNDNLLSSSLSIKSKISNVSSLKSNLKTYEGKSSSITSSFKIFKICKTKLFRNLVKLCIFLTALSFSWLILKYLNIFSYFELDFLNSTSIY